MEDSKLVCGLNGVLNCVEMSADGGKAEHGKAGAKLGIGYRDAQCPHDLKWINGKTNIVDWKPSDSSAKAVMLDLVKSDALTDFETASIRRSRPSAR